VFRASFKKFGWEPQIARPAIGVICDNYADGAVSKCEVCKSFADNRIQNNNAHPLVKP
jgi:hypothetical protein